MSTEVKVPVLGESVTEATIGEWLKKPGEAVALDEPIASLETDKVAVEVPSPVAGIMGDQVVAVGETVSVGALIAHIEDGAPAAGNAPIEERTEPAAAPAPTPAPAPAPASAPAAAIAKADGGDGAQTLSPAVRRAVLEHGVDPSAIRGSGKDGRLTKEDVLAAASQKQVTARAAAPAPVAMSAPSLRR